MKKPSTDDCLKYLTDNLNDLVNAPTYENSVAEFVKPDAASDLATNWENCEYFINISYAAGKITREVKDELLEIDRLITEASPDGSLYDEKIWACGALNSHEFWKALSEKAKIILNEIKR